MPNIRLESSSTGVSIIKNDILIGYMDRHHQLVIFNKPSNKIIRYSTKPDDVELLNKVIQLVSELETC